jgi:hypothetical protein
MSTSKKREQRIDAKILAAVKRALSSGGLVLVHTKIPQDSVCGGLVIKDMAPLQVAAAISANVAKAPGIPELLSLALVGLRLLPGLKKEGKKSH